MINYLNLFDIDIDCNCLIVIATFAVSKRYKHKSMRMYPKNVEVAKIALNVEEADCRQMQLCVHHNVLGLVDPAKGILCRRQICAIHMHTHLWCVTCQSYSEPYAIS